MSQVNASNPAYMFKAYYRQLSMPTPAEVTPTPTLHTPTLHTPTQHPATPQPPTLQPDPPPAQVRRAGLAVPSIAIILGEGDKLVPRAGAEALKELLPPGAPPRTLATPSSAAQGQLLSPAAPLLLLLRAGVAIHEVREASHQMMQEEPEACIALIEGFLAGCA